MDDELDDELKFIPTHIVTINSRSYPVMLIDGAAYTVNEWYAYDFADLAVDDDGRWLFQGQAFKGTVEAIA